MNFKNKRKMCERYGLPVLGRDKAAKIIAAYNMVNFPPNEEFNEVFKYISEQYMLNDTEFCKSVYYHTINLSDDEAMEFLKKTFL